MLSHRSVVEPKAEYVGRITGMVDCKWIGGSRVSLGQKFDLASGLMEITYDTGAKVILQGPVTYEVEANGGYLAVGKLTGKLEKRGEGREERGEGAANHQIPNPKSQILNPSPLSPLPSPLFVIHTPTATVTDLGTEFGVEVSREGVTETQVFVGEVKIATIGNLETAAGQMRVIRAGQYARIGQDKALLVGERRCNESDKRFTRVMPVPLRRCAGRRLCGVGAFHETGGLLPDGRVAEER